MCQCYISPVWSMNQFMAVLWVVLSTVFSLYSQISLPLLGYQAIFRKKRKPKIFGLKNVTRRGIRKIVTFVICELHLQFSGKNTEAFLKRLKLPQYDRTDTNFIVPLKMYFQRSKSILHGLKRVFNAFRRKPSLGAPVQDIWLVYSYFGKGCRIKCTWQPRKVLLVVLSSLFFKEILNNGRRSEAMDMCLRVLKESTEKQVQQLQCQEQCIDHIPCYLSGLSRAHLFRQPFSKQLYTKTYIQWIVFFACSDWLLNQ